MEFEYRQNLRRVPHLMMDLLLASFPKVRLEPSPSKAVEALHDGLFVFRIGHGETLLFARRHRRPDWVRTEARIHRAHRTFVEHLAQRPVLIETDTTPFLDELMSR